MNYISFSQILHDFCVFWFPFFYDRHTRLVNLRKRIENRIQNHRETIQDLQCKHVGITAEISARIGEE